MVGVALDVLARTTSASFSEDVVHHAAEGARCRCPARDLHVHIAAKRRTSRVKRGSTWIRVAPRSLARIGQQKPTGWASRHVGAHDQRAISVRQDPAGNWWPLRGERGTQTGHRSAVSYSRLVLDRHHAQASAQELLDEVVLLIVGVAPPRLPMVCPAEIPLAPVKTLLDEVGVAHVLYPAHDLGDRPIPVASSPSDRSGVPGRGRG